MFGFRRRRRARLRARPLDPALSQRLGRAVPYLRRLTPAERAALECHAQVLLHEKRFEGCGGLVLTDEMRLVIAAQAALLLLNRPTEYFPTLQGVLVYPQRYVVDAVRPLPGGIVAEGPEARAGEAWYRGSVVLSWLDVLRGAANDHDGDNVVLHEFAHQLDSESGANEGAPRLAEAAARAAWAGVMGAAYAQLQADVASGRTGVLRPYAATSPAEFFAVATEVFFERPAALRDQYPDVYAQMRAYFQQDPAARFESRTDVCE